LIATSIVYMALENIAVERPHRPLADYLRLRSRALASASRSACSTPCSSPALTC
jgi:hypothetical protein